MSKVGKKVIWTGLTVIADYSIKTLFSGDLPYPKFEDPRAQMYVRIYSFSVLSVCTTSVKSSSESMGACRQVVEIRMIKSQ